MLTIANEEQAAAWDGSEGDHWTEHAERYEHAGRRQWGHLVDAGLIGTDDTVLDIGCGTGKSTRDAARLAASGSAAGIDLSARMLERAREQSEAEGLTNVTFVQGDAQVHPFEDAAFDVAISSFGAMFFNDPVAAFTNIARGLRPRGGLALLAWRELARNEWVMSIRDALAMGRDLPQPPPDAPTPFSLAEPERVRRLLGEAGYQGVELESVDEPLEFGTDADDAFGFLQGVGIVEGLTQDLNDAQTAEALDRLRATVVAHDTADGVLFGTSAWLITARRAAAS